MEIVGFFDIWTSKYLILFGMVPINKVAILEQNHKENLIFQSFIQQKYQ